MYLLVPPKLVNSLKDHKMLCCMCQAWKAVEWLLSEVLALLYLGATVLVWFSVSELLSLYNCETAGPAGSQEFSFKTI